MSAKLIKGTEIREEILAEIEAEVAQIKEKHGVVPGLVTILVGENPASISEQYESLADFIASFKFIF